MRYLILLLLCTSCLGTKTITDTTRDTKTTVATDAKEVTEKTTEKTPGLTQRSMFGISPELAGSIEDFTRTIKTQDGTASATMRKEGTNIYFENIIPGNSNTTTDTSSSINTEKAFEEQTTENTKRVIRMIPWWVWVALFIYLLPKLIEVFSIFTNPLKTLFKTKE